ncbi:HAD family hydrolase [Ilumatobacter nonamiensis]|uniref:HAD family hydrolase n=1 Tax=Ilumatobacter nonamiensis TaxID=467093 RepID=UPI000346BDB7|nr:HAD-IB family hydrolase [Ilumatobacter nonamiensis]
MTVRTRTTVAAFDVDGTITDRDCVVPFMRRVTGTRRIAGRLVARPDRMVPVLARRDRDQLKALAAAAAFRGRRIDDLSAIGVTFARFVHEHWLRPDTVALLDQHREAGDRVVLVSASFEIYLRPLGELLGVDDVLATRLMSRDGVATGALDGPNCRGPEKVRRLHRWLDGTFARGDTSTSAGTSDDGIGRAYARVVAYGDSAGDRELLGDADEAHWMQRPRSPKRDGRRGSEHTGGGA